MGKQIRDEPNGPTNAFQNSAFCIPHSELLLDSLINSENLFALVNRAPASELLDVVGM